FWKQATGAADGAAATSSASTGGVSCVFTPRAAIVGASLPTAATCVTTGTGSVTVRSGSTSVSPSAAIAAACAPRATSVTSTPASNSRAPTAPPIAPAPTTTMRVAPAVVIAGSY